MPATRTAIESRDFLLLRFRFAKHPDHVRGHLHGYGLVFPVFLVQLPDPLVQRTYLPFEHKASPSCERATDHDDLQLEQPHD